MKRETYFLRWAKKEDIEGIHTVFYQAAANLGGPVMRESIERFLKSTKAMSVVLESPTKEVVGASISRFPTPGVCYHRLFAIKKDLRGRGLGGGMLTGILQLLNVPSLGKESRPNPYRAHKWFASFPSYNKDVEMLYQAMGFAQEGVLKYHTKNKTDLVIRAFYLEEMLIPRFWHLSHSEVPTIENRLMGELPPNFVPKPGNLGLVAPVVEGGGEGRIW